MSCEQLEIKNVYAVNVWYGVFYKRQLCYLMALVSSLLIFRVVVPSIVERGMEVSNCNWGSVFISFTSISLLHKFATLLFGGYTVTIAMSSWEADPLIIPLFVSGNFLSSEVYFLSLIHI